MYVFILWGGAVLEFLIILYTMSLRYHTLKIIRSLYCVYTQLFYLYKMNIEHSSRANLLFIQYNKYYNVDFLKTDHSFLDYTKPSNMTEMMLLDFGFKNWMPSFLKKIVKICYFK